jgi:hypothetical protein
VKSEIYKCPECEGTGIDDDFEDGKCPECLGAGTIDEDELRANFPPHCYEPMIERRRKYRATHAVPQPARTEQE